MDIREKLNQVPHAPGIYIMKGAREKALYVGKAKNLKNRIRSYFQKSASLDDRKLKMVSEIKDFQYVVTKNELEALVLESNFIKRLKPRFNIILRDDKHYPYIKLTVREKWPRLEVVRRIEKDGSVYFGPYVPAGAMWEMLNFIRRTFPVRICKYNLSKPFRPCVQYQMGRCLAPCSESLRTEQDREKYMEVVDEVTSFIKGEKRELLSNLQERMQRFSDNLQFEEAARIRDRLKALEKAWESQRVIAPELGDLDVIGMYRERNEAVLFVFFIRNGMVIGQRDFFLKKLYDIEKKELVASFIGQFYSKDVLLPPKIILPSEMRLPAQREWLRQKRGRPVKLGRPGNDLESRVLVMANDNALYSFNRHRNTSVDETLLNIREILALKEIPSAIGAIDISNISGSEAVGAFILYEDGKFNKDEYRLFRIKTVQGVDDFAMTGEVVSRYLNKVSADQGTLPQLIFVDGGRGQLKSALTAMQPFNVAVQFAGIAKARRSPAHKKISGIDTEMERIYLPGKKSPVYLEQFSASTHLIQKIRNEVHRVAIQYHRKLRTKNTLASPLEKVSGIGKTRRLLLLKHFGSIDAIRKATIDDIVSLKGMNRKIAQALKESLGETAGSGKGGKRSKQ
jgi:excinuclease ABC subunit C